jgi:diaminopimelate decarboxylase
VDRPEDRYVPLARLDASVYERLAREHGTPFYVYDADSINGRIRRAREAFAGLASVYYAVKANPNLELLRRVRAAADGLDISSGGELEQALLAGFDAARMSFAGPAKTEAELERSIQAGVGCISVESLREIDACARIAGRLARVANVCLRVNPLFLNRSFGLKMGGRAVQFGIDEDALDAAFEALRRHADTLAFQGMHVYAGSQCFEPDGVVEGVNNTFRLVQEAESRSGLHCRVINVGGGFGVSHAEGFRELDVERAVQGLVPALRELHAQSAPPREIVFELGRWLTADAGIYVARVIDAKQSRGKQFYVLDGGLHHHLAAAGTFGAAFRINYPVRNLSRPDATPISCNLAGPSCNPTDLLGIDVELATPEPGDLIGILKSGSYSFTASPLLFLGRPTPAEIVHEGGRMILGRRRRTILDFN